MAVTSTPSPADLRAEVARHQLRLYTLAPRVGLNPGRLGQVLSGRLPLSAEMASRIASAIEDVAGGHG